MGVLRSLRTLKTWWDFPRRRRIPADAVVLDVGCGCAPNMRSNVLADKFLLDDSERSQPIALDGRPLVVCDARHLPFKDKSVDYVICSHLAEHLEEPEALLAELSRVAAAGYVETPSRVREMFQGWEYHRWYVDARDGRLDFEEKRGPLHDRELHEWSSRLFETDPVFEQFIIDNTERLGLIAAYDWRGRIEYSVRRKASSEWSRTAAQLADSRPITREELSAQLARVERPAPTRNERVKSFLARLARRRSDPLAAARLRSMLCCPRCKGELSDGEGLLSCAACAATFPVVGNVYYLVPEQVAGWMLAPLPEAVGAH
jgi:SAM-dependent methyltransferase/uncharacterized protein YbaR (Trm112 family)